MTGVGGLLFHAGAQFSKINEIKHLKYIYINVVILELNKPNLQYFLLPLEA